MQQVPDWHFIATGLCPQPLPPLLPFGPTPSRDSNVPEADYKWAELPGNDGSRGGYKGLENNGMRKEFVVP